MSKPASPRTALCTHTADSVHVRGLNLCTELIGHLSFTEMMFLDIIGRLPDPTETRVLDAVMVTLMEHGLTPSAIATRLTYSSAPEALQGAVAAGLLGAGNVLLGTLETAADLLQRIVADPAGVDVAARREAEEHRASGRSVPGFGHPYHKPVDPRSQRLFELAGELGLPGRHVLACARLSHAVDEVYGKHLTLNASAAIAALLCEIDMPVRVIRGFAVVTRAAGLVAHIHEEMHDPAAWVMARAAESSVEYAQSGTGDH